MITGGGGGGSSDRAGISTGDMPAAPHQPVRTSSGLARQKGAAVPPTRGVQQPRRRASSSSSTPAPPGGSAGGAAGYSGDNALCEPLRIVHGSGYYTSAEGKAPKQPHMCALPPVAS